MSFLRKIVDKTWDKLLPFLGALCVLLPTSPLNMQLVYRDSGVFLYTGWRILNGALPYRDIWDHKPPVIFYINAAGLALSDGSRWGVWLVELALLTLAAFLGFQLIRKVFGCLPSFFSLLLWLLTLVFVLQGGNLTTEYTLPLQFAALWLIQHVEGSKRLAWIFFLIGLTGAVAFFTKQTAVGIWIAFVLYLTFQRLLSRQGRQWVRESTLIAIGALTFSAAVLLFFGVQGAFPQLWNAAFEYNFVYSARTSGDLADRLDSILRGLRPLTRAGLLQVGLAGYAAALALVLFRRSLLDKALPLVFIGLLNLPVELMLIGLPGRTFPHYYMTLLPILALFMGVAVWAVVYLLSIWKISTTVQAALALILAGSLVWFSFNDYLDQVYTYRSFTRNKPVVDYIQQNTSPGDPVLIWGAETSINYFSQRESPTRFVYQSPLHQAGYMNEDMLDEFYEDVIQNRPRLIIDTDTNDPLYRFPISTEDFEEMIAQLEANYCLVRQIDAWKIYEYTEGGCSP